VGRVGVNFRAAPVRVRVPATSANLGPGFDSFGLALQLHDDVVVRVAESGLAIDVAGEGASDVRRDKRNLVARAIRATFDALGGQPRGLEIVCANRIPHSRGLGSSAAAIVAGVVAARELVVGGHERLPDDAALRLAAELEGHPDNVAAALFGGFTVAWTDTPESGPPAVGAVRLDVHPDVVPVVFVPATKASTASARKLLPPTVPHRDAALNAARAGLLVVALTRRPDLLLTATQDRLHQTYRAPAMARSAALVERLRAAGVPATISGAGPTVLALAAGGDAERVAGLGTRWFSASAPAVDSDGARVLPVDAATGDRAAG
jgi:homoserine kinase